MSDEEQVAWRVRKVLRDENEWSGECSCIALCRGE